MDKQRLIEQRILAQHRIIAECLRADPEQVLSLARANLIRWITAYPAGEPPRCLTEWFSLLDKPIEDLIEILTADSEDACRLRSSSPFAGVIGPRERWAILREIADDS